MGVATGFCAASLIALAGSAVYLWHLLRELPPVRRAANLLFPLSQMLVVGFMLSAALRYGLGTETLLLTSGMGLCFVVLDPVLFKSLLTAERAEREAELARLMEEQLAAQREHTRLVARMAEQAGELRAAYLTQVTDIERALNANDEVCTLLALNAAEAATRPAVRRFCQHPAADALLIAKFARCKECNIVFDADAQIPAELALPATELCAILANALDNAIHACLELEGDEPRWIRLAAHLANGTLVVKVENPSHARAKQRERNGSAVGGDTKVNRGNTDGPSTQTNRGGLDGPNTQANNAQLSKQDNHNANSHDESRRDVPGLKRRGKPTALPEHGWGLSIVGEIARRHGGNVEAGAHDGVFTLSAVLLLEEGLS